MDAIAVIRRMRDTGARGKYSAHRDKQKQNSRWSTAYKQAEGRLQAWEEMQDHLDALQYWVEEDVERSKTQDLISL